MTFRNTTAPCLMPIYLSVFSANLPHCVAFTQNPECILACMSADLATASKRQRTDGLAPPTASPGFQPPHPPSPKRCAPETTHSPNSNTCTDAAAPAPAAAAAAAAADGSGAGAGAGTSGAGAGAGIGHGVDSVTALGNCVTDANGAVLLQPVSVPDARALPGAFHPTFTHQGFGEAQTVQGYRKLAVTLSFADPTMHAMLRVTYAARADEGATDVEVCVKDGLPPGCTTDAAAFSETVRSSRMPPGVLDGAPVATYTRNGTAFEVRSWVLDTPAKQAYHRRLQKLAWWLVDAASDIDVENPNWRVFGVFTAAQTAGAAVGPGTGAAAASPNTPRRLAAYLTLFTFVNPLRTERQQALRVCTCLVLPYFQRQGHGEALMDAVYKHAAAVDAYEVTVEAPAPGMSRLRDFVDVRLVHRSGVFAESLAGTSGPDGLPAPPSAAAVAAAGASLRITAQQARRCWEALCLSGIAATDVTKLTRFRLLVKKRFFLEEDMKAVAPTLRKSLLADMYEEEEAAYLRALGKAGLPAPGPVPKV